MTYALLVILAIAATALALHFNFDAQITLDDAVKYSTIGVAVFSIAAVIISYSVYQNAKSTSQQQLRAYLGNIGITLDSKPDRPDRKPTLDVDIMNAGATPATNVRVFIGQRLYPYDQFYPSDFHIPDSEMVESLNIGHILPGRNQHFFWNDPRFYDPSLLEELASHRQRILYVGRVEFDDIYEDRRTLEFCWTMFLAQGGYKENGYPFTNFTFCPKRNGERH